MAGEWILKEASPSEIQNHPANIEIYGAQPLDNDMLASIEEFGVLEPLRCTKGRVVLSGHRRLQHALAAKLDVIPILVSRKVLSEPEQIVEIVESNRQRIKTKVQLAREYARLSDAKAELARKRQLTGKKADLGKKFSQGIKGRAKAQAASELGMSRPTAEKAAAVVAEIDKATAAGDSNRAEHLCETLNKGNVSAAYREATGKKADTKSRKPRNDPPPKSEVDSESIERLYSELAEAIDAMASACNQNNSLEHREVTGLLSKSLVEFKAFAKLCKASIGASRG